MPKVHVTYFALLREQRGLGAETLETTAGDAATLYDELRGRHGFSLPRERVRVAIGGDFARWEQPLVEGAELAFIPPVAGG